MSTRDVDKIERSPARVVKDPSNLAAAFPYGGTELGAFRALEHELFGGAFPIPYEEWCGVPGDAVEGADWCIAYGLMRQWDATALAFFFRNTTTGASSGGKMVHGTAPGTVRSGALLSGRAAKILIVPDNPTDHEALYLPLAGPVIVGESRVAMSILKERNLAVSFMGFPDATGRCYVQAKIADITL
jgi:hypothetical protein